MTVAELAKRLNASVPEIFEHYKKISEHIPQDENYVLTTEQIKRAIPNYNTEESSENLELQIERKGTLVPTRVEDLKSKLEERRAKRIEILDNLEPFFKKADGALLTEIKKHNSIPDFILEGDFRKIEGNGFGFFKNISHQNGTALTYPVSNDLIDEIFIPSGELSNGKRYSFEATIARRNERTKKANPFLLQAKSDNIKEIIELSAISQEIKVKQDKLEVINNFLQNSNVYFELRKSEVEKDVLNELQKKQAEANSIIEEYNKAISHKYNEVQEKKDELILLSENVEKRKFEIDEELSRVFKEEQDKINKTIESQEKTIQKQFKDIIYNNDELKIVKKSIEKSKNNLQEMENLLSTLKDRVSLCRNLQFISEDDENKYLNLLSAKEFKPINHLDFEKDFENNFSKLADHIHAYLYHEKNLIYTSYQIRNFLTLLRTHDIIVLSGLSGSGKTQIVKAFAEALGGVAKIIPVKPNWTSSDDLIGYYNPLQMSFLPTPFTEAIVEAINNPNQLYFICLDEMNLARVEYYFADFLSKLEERSKQPEIELYANHEEELFVSEFSTLLNLIESSIEGKKIKSWQEFLDNEEARKKFFEMLGNTDKESMLQLHAKMKRRLMDILKFPSTIRIPDNVRFIGAINVDETTHYFSPKILDRIHVVKFDNPLLFEEQVNGWFENIETEKELNPVYVQPKLFSERKELPTVNNSELSTITQKLKEINQKFLLPLNIDFGIRSIRQSLNYAEFNKSTYDKGDVFAISLNTVILQKIFPRFIFDGSETAKNGVPKIKVVEEFQKFLSAEFYGFYNAYESDETDIGKLSSEYLEDMIKQANRNNSQFNFFA
jgi:hypothetical protein